MSLLSKKILSAFIIQGVTPRPLSQAPYLLPENQTLKDKPIVIEIASGLVLSYLAFNHPIHEPLALDGRVIRKISKCHFFQDIKNSFHGVTQIGLKPHQNFFKFFFSTNTVARGVQSFCILEGATHPLIKQ